MVTAIMHILHCAFSACILIIVNLEKGVPIMIPVGVGRGLMSSMERIANQEITEKRQKKTEEKKEVGSKGLIAKFLLGIRF